MNRTPERTNFQPVKNSSNADVALNTAYIQGQFQSVAQPCLSRRMPVVLGTFTSRPRLFKRRIALSIGKNIIRRKSIRKTDCTIHWIETYPLDSLRMRAGAPNDNFRKNTCSEDYLRSRIFGTFVVKFLACLLLLGFSNI